MGLKQAISKRIHKAKMVGAIVKDSLLVNMRRTGKKRRFYSSQLKAVIVDLDGTLLKTDSSLEELKFRFPKKIKGISEGELIYGKLINSIIDGSLSVDEAMILGMNLLNKNGFCMDDLYEVFEIIKPQIRVDLVKSLKLIQMGLGAKIILATLSSKEFAEILDDYLWTEFEFRFDAIIGSELFFSRKGKAKKLVKIIGLKSRKVKGIEVKSKFDAVQELLNEKKWHYSLNEFLFITDGYGDIELIKKMPSLLITQKENASLIQKVSKQFRMADFIVQDDGKLKEKMVKIVLGAK